MIYTPSDPLLFVAVKVKSHLSFVCRSSGSISNSKSYFIFCYVQYALPVSPPVIFTCFNFDNLHFILPCSYNFMKIPLSNLLLQGKDGLLQIADDVSIEIPLIICLYLFICDLLLQLFFLTEYRYVYEYLLCSHLF